jgi:hypothetical protein
MRAAATLMTNAASAWLEALDEEQRSLAAWPFPSEDERTRWFYTPTDHGGLMLGAMTRRQEEFALRLLRSGLSRSGYVTAVEIMSLENVLAELEGWPDGSQTGLPRDPGRYYLRVFGEPGRGSWGWRVGGHHLSLHYTMVDGDVRAATPSFFGADPAASPMLGRQLHRPLAAVEDLARELVRSLDEQQSSRAIVSAVPPIDMVGGNRSVLGDREDPLRLSQIFRAPISDALRAVLDEAQRSNEERIGLGQAHLEAVRYGSDAKGLRADELLASQQATLRTLLDAYVSRFPDDLAELESAKFTGGNLAALSFAWAGSTEPRRPHYYRIQGPRLVVEYDNVQRDTNHVHTIWRDPEGDFGRDALAEHHASAHH